MRLRKEKTTITIENYRRVLTRSTLEDVEARCTYCSVVTRMISPGEAATLLRSNVREIFRLIESGSIHFSESFNEMPLVCSNSVRILR